MPPKRPQGTEPRTPAKARMKLQYDSTSMCSQQPNLDRSVDGLVPPRQSTAFAHGQDLVFMVVDVVEEAVSRLQVWGTTPEGATVLCRIQDFKPYFYIATPRRTVAAPPGHSGSGFEAGVLDEALDVDDPHVLESLRAMLNQTVPADSRVQRIEPVQRRPMMYYRPDCPDGETYLRMWLAPAGNARRAGTAVLKTITGGSLRREGLVWRDQTVYEYEVAPLQRFLADVPLSAGAWVCIPPAASSEVGAPPKRGGPSRSSSAAGFAAAAPQEKVSTCDVEVVAPWAALQCLTPDAVQLADQGWAPSGAGARHEGARRGDIAPLRVLVMDVCTATRDGSGVRTPVPAEGDPVVAVSCALFTQGAEGGASAAPAEGAPLGGEGDEDGADGGSAGEEESEEGGPVAVAPTAAAVGGGPSSAQHAARPSGAAGARPVVFALAGSAAAAEGPREASELMSNATVLLFDREEELLLTWRRYFLAADPDVLAVYQVGDTLVALLERFAALNLDGGALHLSRHVAACSRPVAVKRVTMYSAAWVRSQSRMASTSNQETFRAEVDGRLVVDVLRQVLTNKNLASFSLVDSVQSQLGETLEVLPNNYLAALAGITPSGTSSAAVGAGAAEQLANSLRLARYSMRRVEVVGALLARLATIEEAIEMARATGLTVGQVMYNAQMIRTWSLLLRVTQRQGFIIPARPESAQLTEHTFILHPVEAGTVGLYRQQPVAILDFASLYPSIYRAHNLCYTTLLHKDDAAAFPPDQVTTTPTGATFVKSQIRPGILPSILAALITARAATRRQLMGATSAAQRAVLDSRQRALKLTANALYGFTGAQASPLQCLQLADSCLAYGAQSCRRAKQVLEAAAASGELAPHGTSARVIYGNTDSLFVLFPEAGDVAAAISAGRRAAEVVTAAFPPPMELKFERVCSPFLLLHVNRYAGRAFEREDDVAKGGELIVKGLKSMWRQTAPLLRTTLHGALVRILMRDDVRGAVEFVEGEIRRLLSGKVELNELAMTGGLWRVTGEQVERAAAAEEGAPVPEGEEVRGPHSALAVRLSQRDPGRSFVLGERLQYVLLAGHRLQEAAAEDPLEAARAGLQADLELYWKNKLQKPLAEVFATCLTPAQLQNLLHGPHARVRVDAAAVPRPSASAAAALGPSSPSPGKGRGGKAAPRQTGMMQFFSATAKCLACKRAMPGWRGAADDAPGLCESCAGQEGRWGEVYVGLMQEEADQEARQCAAHAACRQCHSGLAAQSVLCQNAECPLTYTRLSTNARLQGVRVGLRRMDISF